MNFKETENTVLDKYAEILKSKGYTLEKEYKLKIWRDRWLTPDAVIKDQEGNIVSIIEAKINLRDNAETLHKIEKIASEENIKFCIIINFINQKEGSLSYFHELHSTRGKTTKPIEIFKNEEGIFQIINELINKYNTKFSLNDIKFLEDSFRKGIIDFLQYNDMKNSKKLKKLIEESKEESIIEGNDPFSFKTSFENKFFEIFFPPQKISSVCRYTSFNTLFKTLDDKKYRMNGICGMNDKSEINFVENNFIYKNNKTNATEQIKNINNTFIMSCCDLKNKDNLMMWRLYGDDAKGVNLIFDIKDQDNEDFRLRAVSYNTKILELLDKIVDIFNEYGHKFIFKRLYYYKHFFKSEDYKNEKEIRLLCKGKNGIQKKWQITQPFNILNPYIEIDATEFPFKLREIILGPTLKEQIVNKKQLESFLIENGYYNIEISLSKIEHYRNSY